MNQLPEFIVNPDPELYKNGRFLVLDFETTGKEKGTALRPDNELILSCWIDSRAQSKTHYCWGSEYEQHELLAAIEEVDFIVAHNAKFELQWLSRCGYDLGSKPVFCTQVAEWVLAGNQPWGRFASLDECLDRRGLGSKDQLVGNMIKGGVPVEHIPEKWLLRYCARDVRKTKDLFFAQLRETVGTRLLPVIYTRCLTTPALADMEFKGMVLDSVKVREEYEKYQREYAEVMREMDQFAPGVNPNSPAQMAHFIYGELGFKELTKKDGTPIRNQATKQFPDGAPKVDKTTLNKLKPETEEQRRFFELKSKQAKLSAALNKNLKMFYGAVEEKGGHIYATLNQCKTATHRLASSGRSTYFQTFEEKKGCQFQNLPHVFKPLFKARHDDWYYVEADMAQLEYRVAGHAGREPVILDELAQGFDVHKYTASIMFNVELDEVQPMQRKKAKAETFKPLYGGSKGTPEQEAYYKAFQTKYNSLYETQLRWCEQVRNNKLLETEWGMRFYWPHAKSYQSGNLNVMTEVFNYPIQSLATADMVPIGVTYLWHRTRHLDLLLINTVHDSVLAEVPPNEMELFADAVVQAFTWDVYLYLRDVYDMPFTVPLGVGMVAGKNWTVSSATREQWNSWLRGNEFKYNDGEVTVTVTPEEVYI